MKESFTAYVWPEEETYIAACEENSVASQGESEQEALENLRDALSLYLAPPVSTLMRQRLEEIGPGAKRFRIEVGLGTMTSAA